MPKQDKRLTFVQNFICGGNAGVVCRTVCSPLDVVKTLQQVGTADAASGMTRTFINQYKNEGIKAFYKGNLIACLRGFPYYAIQFAVYERSKQILSQNNSKVGSLLVSVSGALSGVSAVILTYPLDMVKTRLTAQHADLSRAKYKGILDAFKVISREEGIFAIYKGLGTSVIGPRCLFISRSHSFHCGHLLRL
ncbi:solute carrier family 25 member 43-like [Octopus sinensis]|uniref:Solute carrier family 25 member 43-like n=1 Tax=Octopus sinensis TaxID=2607531 RepID=A0A6P7U0I1_9MOLL|nr:solute carrier family 25 member 43-like [Octopus sinensis]